MIVHVYLFARAKDLIGTDLVVLELPQPATVADLRRRLADRFPALAPLLPRSGLAVNEEYARDDQPLTADDEVALVPPVSGG
jgi:molybdopterin converting factor subunit 1